MWSRNSNNSNTSLSGPGRHCEYSILLRNHCCCRAGEKTKMTAGSATHFDAGKRFIIKNSCFMPTSLSQALQHMRKAVCHRRSMWVFALTALINFEFCFHQEKRPINFSLRFARIFIYSSPNMASAFFADLKKFCAAFDKDCLTLRAEVERPRRHPPGARHVHRNNELDFSFLMYASCCFSFIFGLISRNHRASDKNSPRHTRAIALTAKRSRPAGRCLPPPFLHGSCGCIRAIS